MVEQAEAAGKYNVAFEAAYLLGDSSQCFDILQKSKKMAEAAFFARAYAPSLLEPALNDWVESLKSKELPFQPENVMKIEAEIMQQALEVEGLLKEKFSSENKNKVQEYEQVKEEYFKDISAWGEWVSTYPAYLNTNSLNSVKILLLLYY